MTNGAFGRTKLFLHGQYLNGHFIQLFFQLVFFVLDLLLEAGLSGLVCSN